MGCIPGSDVYIRRLHSMFRAWKAQRYVQVYDDEEYKRRMEYIMVYHFIKMNAQNPLKFCKHCYAFVTRKMQEKYKHEDAMDFEYFLEYHFDLSENSGLKEIAAKKNLNTKDYWYMPGFRKKPCIARKYQPETKLAKRTDLIVQATDYELVPKVLKKDKNATKNTSKAQKESEFFPKFRNLNLEYENDQKENPANFCKECNALLKPVKKKRKA